MSVEAAPINRRSEFNSWIIGGQYTKNAIKKQQVLSPAKIELDQAHKHQLETRRNQLKEERDKFCAEYKPKVSTALREKRDRTDAAAHQASNPAPPRKASPERAKTEEHSSLALRNRLRDSFAQITATHAYGTLFPPLLTPYNRTCLVGNGPERPKSPPKELADMKEMTLTPQTAPNSLSVTKNERRRIQPVSGPKAFFPTGSTTAAYRHFCQV